MLIQKCYVHKKAAVNVTQYQGIIHIKQITEYIDSNISKPVQVVQVLNILFWWTICGILKM